MSNLRLLNELAPEGHVRILLLLLSMGSLINVCAAQQPSDAELFSEGRIALDTYKDCAHARRALDSESAPAKDSPVWLEYAARAAECLGDLETGLSYYEKELAKLPGTPRLIDKIGDLRYRVKITAEQNAQRAAERERLSEQQRIESERVAQLQATRSEVARAHLPDTYAQISDLLNVSYKGQLDWTGFHSKKKVTLNRTVTYLDNCTLKYTETYTGGLEKRQDIVISLIGARAGGDSGEPLPRGAPITNDTDICANPVFNDFKTCVIRVNGGPGSSVDVAYIEVLRKDQVNGPGLTKLINSAGDACRQ